MSFVLVLSAHRLPAPISEAPAPEVSAKPIAKHSKQKVKNEEGSTQAKVSKSQSSGTRPSGTAKNLTGPAPDYPPEAARQKLSGRGVYLLHFNQSTGTVIDVTVVESAGSPLLDQASITAFRQWHEDPNCAKEATLTMTFTRTGVQKE
ncbi:MAG TPA: TonB family protein [Chthoniobacterales bacterium]